MPPAKLRRSVVVTIAAGVLVFVGLLLVSFESGWQKRVDAAVTPPAGNSANR